MWQLFLCSGAHFPTSLKKENLLGVQRKGALLRNPLLVERTQAPGANSRTIDITNVLGYRHLCSENVGVEGLLVELTGDAIGEFRTSQHFSRTRGSLFKAFLFLL